MTAWPARRIAVALVFLVLALGAARDFSRLGAALPWRTMDDFPDFYCAGWALDRVASPYTYEPLRTCEHRANEGQTFRGRVFAANPTLAIPAPQPPYDFLPFMALARGNFTFARILDATAIVAAVLLCAMALAALGVPIVLALAVFALSTGYVELNTGQIVPFALLALLGCGVSLSRGRDWLAGLCAALVAIEPAAGLPVIAAMLWFVPRARCSLAGALAALGLIAYAIVGRAGIIQYLTVVLPAHAQSELHFPFQYSLTYALAALGVSSPLAALAGTASSVLLAAAGLAIAPKAGARLQRRELIAFIPALCSVIGGPFLHQEELCFALPAVTILAWRSIGTQRAICAIALCVLAIPWIAVWGEKHLFLASLLVCATILAQLRMGMRWSVPAFVAIAVAIYCLELAPPHLPTPSRMAGTYAATEIVQREWRDYTERRSTTDVLWYAIKIPTWAALLAALAIAARVAWPPDQRAGAGAVSISARI